MEAWKDIPGFVGAYQVSSLGRVRSLDRYVEQTNRWGQLMLRFAPGQILKPKRDRDGYLRLHIRALHPHNAVHRMAALAFLGEPPLGKNQVNHKNGNTSDNRIENLEWVSNSENHKHAFRELGREPQRAAKKAVVAVSKKKRLKFASAVEAAEALGLNRSSVYASIKFNRAHKGYLFQYAEGAAA